MSRLLRAPALGMALGFLAVASARPLTAQVACTAHCGCYCDSSYNECSAVCGAQGWFAVCNNGFCDGPDRECCCYYISFAPVFFFKQCADDTSCGFPPPVQCSLREAPDGKFSKTACDALTKRGAEDRWYFLTYRVDAKGIQDFRITSTSHQWFTDALLACAAQGFIPRGWVPRDAPSLAQGFVVQTDFFEYLRSADSLDVTGRLVMLSFPTLGDLSGDLAIRLKTSREGDVLEKKLLFSSNGELGRKVLEHFEAGLEIVKPGKGAGPFIDILTLKFQNGEMAVFLQTHHAKPER